VWLVLISLCIFLWAAFQTKEGFAYNENPCKAFGDCRSCAGAAGCGWCSDLGQCQPMAQDGFPIRTADLTTGAPGVSPYIMDGAIPVISDCPPRCKQNDLGDCECAKSYYNSCAPDCYAVYGQGCVCPNSADYGSSGSSLKPRATGEEVDLITRLAKTTAAMNQLLKTTRLHICSPHTFIIDPCKC